MGLTINIVGAGRIGRPVIDQIRSNADFALGRILTRSGKPDTSDIGTFLAHSADIIIDTAGPAWLRAHGVEVIDHADVWTVGGAALADDGFRAELEDAARRAGHRLRLFSHWIAGADHAGPGSTLHIRQHRPGDGWSGSLREAAEAHADTVNSAVSAALVGPGLDTTTFELVDSGHGGGHAFEANLETPFGRFSTQIDFGDPDSSEPHPTAAALIAALWREVSPIQYG